jgi:hypothetical protein
MMEIPTEADVLRNLIKSFPIRSMAVRQQWVRQGMGCPQCGAPHIHGTYLCEDLNCRYNAAPLVRDTDLARYTPDRETEDA